MRRWKVFCFPLALLLLSGLQTTPAAPGKPPVETRGVDTYVVGDQMLVPGTWASLRLITEGVTGLVSSKPLPLAQVTLLLRGEEHKEKMLFRGRSNSLGIVDAKFQVPLWPDGSYQMLVRTQTPFGSSELEHSVNLKRTGKIWLVTDKPIYQPNQVIQMRALSLNPFNLEPLSDLEIRFAVQDPKGNQVFKKRIPTNAFGVASVSLRLADEINLGNYQIEAACEKKDAAEPASKTVVVKKYLLPKFKVEVETDRAYYLPKQTIQGKIRADYFFGKPVAGAEVEVKAATFDVAFKEFGSLRGRTDQDGRWEFELALPDYFVGQPLQKGDALVRLEVKVTDTAKHGEKSTRNIPVAATPIRLDAVPEGGRVVAGVENRIYVVATYPDGSPARATVAMKRGEQPASETRTDETGLGVITVKPMEEEMRDGGWQPSGSFEPERGRSQARGSAYLQTRVLDLQFEARDEQGNRCQVPKSFATDPAGDRILLRTDQAIYENTDTVRGTVLTTAGEGTGYLDIIKNRQTLLTRSVSLSQGRGDFEVPLGPEVFGTIELHAYKLLKDGEIMRDARVLYVQPPRALSITVSRDKSIYRPGEEALFQFRVLDGKGQPASAALGVIIVDEAVYALQELQPGLEKVYFTLEKELTDPKYQIEFGPSEDLASLVKAERLQAQKQQVAKLLLANAAPAGGPVLWSNPRLERMQKAAQDRYTFYNALYGYGQQHPLGKKTRKGKWAYRKGLVAEMVKGRALSKQQARDPLGDSYTLETIEALWPELRAETFLAGQELGRLWNLRSQMYNLLHQRTAGFSRVGDRDLHAELYQSFQEVIKQPYLPKTDLSGQPYRWEEVGKLPGFRIEDLLNQVHAYRVQQIYYALSRYGRESERWFRISVLDQKRDAYVLPRDVLKRVVKRGYLNEANARDIWGRPFLLRVLDQPGKQAYYDNRLRFYQVYSLGPDGRDGTPDDLAYAHPESDGGYQELAKAVGYRQPVANLEVLRAGGGVLQAAEVTLDAAPVALARGMPRSSTAPHPSSMPETPPGKQPVQEARAEPAAPKKREVRIREYFPETLWFVPSLITDGNGEATLKVVMADSITTWRMTASANARQGGLGSLSHGVRVFQDFFVDLDLPVSLTQNDEVSIPVVVYNYLKRPQRVRLELERSDWFELAGGRVQEMELEPSEVSATYYRIQVKGLGRKTLQVRADGSSMSDAIRREIEVLPDGKEENLVDNGRLEGTVKRTIEIPETSVAGASKILVRLYPGVFSQVIEGMESLLRLPGG